jgi:dTDP-4-amino-4,6-dideoxygalactose transaminase
MKVSIFDLKFEDDFIESFKVGCEKILRSDSIGEGRYVNEFENKFANLTNAKHAIAVTSGTAALEIALNTIGVDGKNVIMPSNTFFATSVAVTNAGGHITLVDSEIENFSICPIHLRTKITKNTGAVIIVHIGGIISKNIREIKEICDQYSVPLIEDAAHAHCSNYDGLHAGTIGDIGCFSFFPTKVMTTGEGGMITTNSDSIADKVRSLKNFGRALDNSGICVLPGGQNSKINEFTGLLGSLECDRVMFRIKKRNDLLQRYIKNLKDTKYEIVTQKTGLCAYYKCILKSDLDRTRLKSFCKKKGISMTGEVYSKPVHQQPLYSFVSITDLPNTEKIANIHVCPPLYPELEFEHIDYICEVLIEAEELGDKL